MDKRGKRMLFGAKAVLVAPFPSNHQAPTERPPETHCGGVNASGLRHPSRHRQRSQCTTKVPKYQIPKYLTSTQVPLQAAICADSKPPGNIEIYYHHSDSVTRPIFGTRTGWSVW